MKYRIVELRDKTMPHERALQIRHLRKEKRE